MATEHPPTVEHLAAHIRPEMISPHGVYLITFTTGDHGSDHVDIDIRPVDQATLTEYGLPVILHAFASGFADHTPPSLYEDVAGYGVAVNGRTYIVDRHGSALPPARALPRGDDGDILTALQAMIDSGPGNHTVPRNRPANRAARP